MSQSFIRRMDKFLFFIEGFLALAVSIVLLFAIGMLFFDIISMISNKYAEGIGTVLGSLLVIWVLLELLEAQLDHLKGKKPDATIFVIVALVAFIRKLLVASLKPDKIELAYFSLVAIVVLALVYFAMNYSIKNQIKSREE